MVAQFSQHPKPTLDQALGNVATSRYGEHAASEIIKTWSQFSQAFTEYPYCVSFLYRGPMQRGPANLLSPDPTRMKSTMVGFPFDDIEGWKWKYPADVLESQLEKIASGWRQGLVAFENALPQEMTPSQKTNTLDDYRIAEAACLYFQSGANQIRFILARDKLPTATADPAQRNELINTINTIASDELAIAKRFFALSREDSRFGFEATNYYYYLPFDFIEKAINCDYIIKHWLPEQPVHHAP